MRFRIFSPLLRALLFAHRGQANIERQEPYYTDIHTNIRFYGHAEPGGYLFGLVISERPTTDFIAQLVVPLNHSKGWGGVSLGDSMIGPLLLVTWADGSDVMTAARIANAHSAASVVPYTTSPITISPIRAGAFANNTHVFSTFLCGGCINNHSFDPNGDGDVFFGYAYSRTAVADPSDIDTTLSDHTGKGGGYGGFSVALGRAKSAAYYRYAQMAEIGDYGVKPEPPRPPATPTTSTPAPIPNPTPTDEWRSGCNEDECGLATEPDYNHEKVSWPLLFGLVTIAVIYFLQPFIS